MSTYYDIEGHDGLKLLVATDGYDVWYHRDTTFDQYVIFPKRVLIDGISYMIARLRSDGKWWIVADDGRFDAVFQDLGPFSNVSEAIICGKLAQDSS